MSRLSIFLAVEIALQVFLKKIIFINNNNKFMYIMKSKIQLLKIKILKISN